MNKTLLITMNHVVTGFHAYFLVALVSHVPIVAHVTIVVHVFRVACVAVTTLHRAMVLQLTC